MPRSPFFSYLLEHPQDSIRCAVWHHSEKQLRALAVLTGGDGVTAPASIWLCYTDAKLKLQSSRPIAPGRVSLAALPPQLLLCTPQHLVALLADGSGVVVRSMEADAAAESELLPFSASATCASAGQLPARRALFRVPGAKTQAVVLRCGELWLLQLRAPTATLAKLAIEGQVLAAAVPAGAASAQLLVLLRRPAGLYAAVGKLAEPAGGGAPSLQVDLEGLLEPSDATAATRFSAVSLLDARSYAPSAASGEQHHLCLQTADGRVLCFTLQRRSKAGAAGDAQVSKWLARDEGLSDLVLAQPLSSGEGEQLGIPYPYCLLCLSQ
jgi:hypothetical protein